MKIRLSDIRSGNSLKNEPEGVLKLPSTAIMPSRRLQTPRNPIQQAAIRRNATLDFEFNKARAATSENTMLIIEMWFGLKFH
jgi:hypothetical protein